MNEDDTRSLWAGTSGIGEEGDDPHLAAACGTDQRIDIRIA
jgi:hypothetical protein